MFVTAVLAGCVGSEPPTGAPGAQRQWSAPDARGRNLLYISNGGSVGVVFVYTYPRGKLIGTLAGFEGAHGLCSDQAGDVFVPTSGLFGGTYVFAHGGQAPIAYLSYYYGGSDGCSVDPATGSLAVIGGSSSAYVTIYRNKPKRGWRLGRSYPIPGMVRGGFCGYDDQSNLFCDGTTSSGRFALAELPKESKPFLSVAVDQGIKAPGQVQWDGTHLAIGDTGVSPSVIYQFDVSGSTATEVGSTTLKSSVAVKQFWIQASRVIAPDEKRSCGNSDGGCVALYRYPSGGSATKTIALPAAFGATVSLAR